MKASETDMSQHAGYAGENAGIPHRRTLQLSKNPPAKRLITCKNAQESVAISQTARGLPTRSSEVYGASTSLSVGRQVATQVPENSCETAQMM